MDEAWNILDILASTSIMVNSFNLQDGDDTLYKLKVQEWSTTLKVQIMNSPESEFKFKLAKISASAGNCDNLIILRDHIDNILEVNELGTPTSQWLFIILRNVGLLHELPMLI